MSKKKVSVWEHWISKEINIELKACLYFFCILFYYAVYKLLGGSVEANIIHMTEMIFVTYGMGYVQTYFFGNFDEKESWKGREICYLLCSICLYTGISFLGNWFQGSIPVTIGFAIYMGGIYACVFVAFRWKRQIDGRIMNEELQAFQKRKE